MFRKTAELPQKPDVIRKSSIYEDLLVTCEDPLFSDAVEQIVSTNDPVSSNHKSANASQSFDTISKMLRTKEDMSVLKKSLLEKFEILSSLRDNYKQTNV